MQPDTRDKLLKRRLYLQRYITLLFNDVRELAADGDAELIRLLQDFVMDADEKALVALSRLRTSNADARAVLERMRSIVREQQSRTIELMTAEVEAVVEREGASATKAMDESAGEISMRGVATMAIAGTTITDMFRSVFEKYFIRLRAAITQAAANDPGNIVSIVRGTRSAQMKDGILRWRDDRLIFPNVDVSVHGASNNAMHRVYEAFRVEKVDHVATLDYRLCIRCYTAAVNGPYELGKQPRIPVHPRCRCINAPHIADDANERPFVRDSRPVRKIPKNERNGKVGTTSDSIEEFFERMSKQDLREYLGQSRYELWQAGKINDIKSLVDERNLRPLRLDELPEL